MVQRFVKKFSVPIYGNKYRITSMVYVHLSRSRENNRTKPYYTSYTHLRFRKIYHLLIFSWDGAHGTAQHTEREEHEDEQH